MRALGSALRSLLIRIFDEGNGMLWYLLARKETFGRWLLPQGTPHSNTAVDTLRYKDSDLLGRRDYTLLEVTAAEPEKEHKERCSFAE